MIVGHLRRGLVAACGDTSRRSREPANEWPTRLRVMGRRVVVPSSRVRRFGLESRERMICGGKHGCQRVFARGSERSLLEPMRLARAELSLGSGGFFPARHGVIEAELANALEEGGIGDAE